MLRPQGYATLYDPDQGLKEKDTFTCTHCNRVVHVPVKNIETVGDFCRSCMSMVCLACAGKGCTPFLKKIEMEEARDRLRRQSYS